ALIALRQQHWAAAGRSLEEGVALARRMPHPYAEARLLHMYGRLHIQKGEPEAAREQLEAALAIFQRLGARADVARTEQALATLTPVACPPRAAALPGGAVAPGERDGGASGRTGQRLSRPARHAWALA